MVGKQWNASSLASALANAFMLSFPLSLNKIIILGIPDGGTLEPLSLNLVGYALHFLVWVAILIAVIVKPQWRPSQSRWIRCACVWLPIISILGLSFPALLNEEPSLLAVALASLFIPIALLRWCDLNRSTPLPAIPLVFSFEAIFILVSISFYWLPPAAQVGICIPLPFLYGMSIYIVKPANEPSTEPWASRPRPFAPMRSWVSLAGGLMLISLVICLFRTFTGVQGGNSSIASSTALGEILVLIFIAVLMVNKRFSFSRLFKSIVIICAVGVFLHYSTERTASEAALTLFSCAHDMQDLVMILASIVLFQSHGRPAALTEAVFFFANTLGMLIGAILGEMLSELAPQLFVGLQSGIGLALTIAAFGAFSDRTIQQVGLLDGNQQPAPERAMIREDNLPSGASNIPSPLIELVAGKFDLTRREVDVLTLLAAGRSAPFIGQELFISQNTVRTHIRNIYRKCGVANRQEILTLVESFAEQPAPK